MVRDTIRYFMWSFQPHFRHSMQMGAERAFETIGFGTKPRALLIGFGTKSDSWPICIEPEYRFFQPEHLEGVRTRAEDLYGSHAGRSLMHSDARLHERYHQVLRDRCRADALVEALEMHSPEPISYFAGISSRVGDYEVHPVIGVPVHAIGVVPQLTTEEVDERPAVRSLVHSCIDLLLGLSRQALYQPEAGDSLDVLGVSAEELVRRAATNLVTSAARSTGSLFGNSIFSSLVAVSTTRYEGATGFGSLILAADPNEDVRVDLRLQQPVALSETRTVRKLLEISDRDRISLLTDGSKIYGLGRVEASYLPSTQKVFELDVVGSGQWTMRHAGAPLLTVEFGQPHLPKDRIDRKRFADTVSRLFKDSSPAADTERLWSLAHAAAEQAHGTMLVITESAGETAARLSAQAIGIEETELSPELLQQATSIDGAVLFAPDGTCHAIGVILDGRASSEGDRSRGARYNSAVRYLSGASSPTMIVLVSEDGMINVLPELHPRISRETLANAIEIYRMHTTAEEVDAELRADAWDRLEELAFYLSEEQCDLINELETKYQDDQLAGGHIALTGRKFTRQPAMNDSYFDE